jgi:hypothetical protein
LRDAGAGGEQAQRQRRARLSSEDRWWSACIFIALTR